MSDTLRQDIIFKILKIASDNSDLSSDEQFKLAESGTQALFAQLINESTSSSSGGSSEREKARTKRRMQKKDRNQRKEHVGRFFLRLMEKNIRKPGLPDCLFPVFAKSVQTTIGEDNYEAMSGKISRLLEFGEKKGYDYDQILDSKPGKSIAGEILALYKSEMGGGSFEKQLKNSLDETLVKNIPNIENGADLNIEDTVSLAYSEFSKFLTSKAS
ncbi:MAG: hypothetical protein VW455_09515 [Nitrospinota bacterium]